MSYFHSQEMLTEFKTGNTTEILSVAPSVEYTKYKK